MTSQIVEPSDDQITFAVETLKLLADPTRLRIVWALLHGEHSVNELAEHVGVQPTTVSQHLSKLRLSRVVRTRREGTKVFYRADDEHVRRLAEQALFHADHVVNDQPAHHVGRRTGRTA